MGTGGKNSVQILPWGGGIWLRNSCIPRNSVQATPSRMLSTRTVTTSIPWYFWWLTDEA